MDFFLLRQDRRYIHASLIANLTDIIKRRSDASQEHASKIDDINVGFSNCPEAVDWIDVLDRQVYMVSDRVKRVFQIYEPSMAFKAVCILNNATEAYGNYHIPIVRKLDCLSAESKVSPDRTHVSHLVLRKPQIEEYSIFKVGGLEADLMVIRLDVAESLLRRHITKFKLERIALV